MNLVPFLDYLDEATLAALFGLLTGAVFGVAAQRSAFCLRAATVEFARGRLGPKVSVWLLAFSTAVIWVQGAQLLGLFRVEEARMMAVAGSWSGAVIGGLIAVGYAGSALHFKRAGHDAAILGVTADTLRQQIAAGRLRAAKRGRDWHVTRGEVERYRRDSLGKRAGGTP